MKKTLEQLIKNLVLQELRLFKSKAQLSEAFRGFNLSFFKRLDTIDKMLEYAENHLPKLGRGSSRVVFGLGSGKVLKIQWDKYYGSLQNEGEVKTYTNPKIPVKYLAKIYDFDPNFAWLISEGVQVIGDNSQLLKKISINEILLEKFVMAISQKKSYEEALQDAIQYSNINSEYEVFDTRQNINKINVNDLNQLDMQLLQAVFVLTKLGIEDIDRFDHWGVATDGRIVVVDYGLVFN